MACAQKMTGSDVEAEEEAIACYRQTIKLAEDGDITAKRLFEEIQGDEKII